jgi:hypothetical protein
MQNSRVVGQIRLTPDVRFHPRAVALLVAAVIGVWGCGGSSAPSPSSTPTPTPSPLIVVTVTPNSVTVLPGATQSFAASVTGTTKTDVTWSVQENSGGTIDSAGRYTAPQNSIGTFHVVATSQANSAAKGMAAVAVQSSQLTISPVAVTLGPDGAQTFTASVLGSANNSVTWTIQEKGGGLINGAGFYTAPSAVGFYHVVATSVEDMTVTARSTVTVTTSSSGFTPTGSLQQGRGLHTATLLADGRVLVAGGANRATDPHCIGGIASAELYGASGSGSFAPTGALNAGRYAHTATLLQNGQVLVAGGFGDTSACQDVGVQAQNTAELYDPGTGSFKKTGNMGLPRGGHTATLLTNGKVLVAGGEDQVAGGTGSASAELYDPSTGAFTPTGSMNVARFRHTATLLQNGKVLVVGGVPGDSSNPAATAEVYDPATGGFSVTGSMTTAREEHTATLLSDGKVLIAGGESPVTGSGLQATATAEVYDPSTDLFSTTGSMAGARNSHTATLLPSGHVLVSGGSDDNPTAELYDPTTSSFSIAGGMEVGRSGHSATLLSTDIVGGVVLVVGGGSFVPLATAELFYENGNFWDY